MRPNVTAQYRTGTQAGMITPWLGGCQNAKMPEGRLLRRALNHLLKRHVSQRAIERVLSYVREHPESTASLAVFRRALGVERERVDEEARGQLEIRLQQVPDEELEAFYYIVS